MSTNDGTALLQALRAKRDEARALAELAPELLAELKALVLFFGRHTQPGTVANRQIELAENLIRRAEGRA